LTGFVHFSAAMEVVPEQQPLPKYVAQIQLNTAAELAGVLDRADQLLQTGKFSAGSDEPIVFVLHGPEARVFFQQNYFANKQLVDVAARLSAFEVVEVRVCRTWMGGDGLNEEDLPPFVSTVPFGPAEERRLMEDEGYVYF
jgi:intracellular sulfur oxidation DsrE/DsrF family protein